MTPSAKYSSSAEPRLSKGSTASRFDAARVLGCAAVAAEPAEQHAEAEQEAERRGSRRTGGAAGALPAMSPWAAEPPSQSTAGASAVVAGGVSARASSAAEPKRSAGTGASAFRIA